MLLRVGSVGLTRRVAKVLSLKVPSNSSGTRRFATRTRRRRISRGQLDGFANSSESTEQRMG